MNLFDIKKKLDELNRDIDFLIESETGRFANNPLPAFHRESKAPPVKFVVEEDKIPRFAGIMRDDAWK